MTDPGYKALNIPAQFHPETVPISVSDRTPHIDRGYRLLANQRRRFCLYYLDRVDGPLSIRHLAGLVEVALAPPEAEVTDRILDDAVRQFTHTHLPKLRAGGLLQVEDGYVKLVPDSPLPIPEWLSITAGVELESWGTKTG